MTQFLDLVMESIVGVSSHGDLSFIISCFRVMRKNGWTFEKKKKSKVSLTIDFCKSLVIYLYALLSYFNNMKSGENKVFITEF